MTFGKLRRTIITRGSCQIVLTCIIIIGTYYIWHQGSRYKIRADRPFIRFVRSTYVIIRKSIRTVSFPCSIRIIPICLSSTGTKQSIYFVFSKYPVIRDGIIPLPYHSLVTGMLCLSILRITNRFLNIFRSVFKPIFLKKIKRKRSTDIQSL